MKFVVSIYFAFGAAFKSKMKTKINPSLTYTFFRVARRLPDSTLSCHWLMFMLTFVLIDGCEYFWFSLSRVRVDWFFDNQFKNFLSKIHCISNNLSFKVNVIYTPFSYFLSSPFFFFTETD